MTKNICILFSTADWDAPYWTNKQHTAVQFAEHGWTVVYVESIGLRRLKTGSSRDWNRIAKRLIRGLSCLLLGPRHLEKDIFVVSPLCIPILHANSYVSIINQFILRKMALEPFESVGKKKILWTYHPYIMDLVNEFSFDQLIYHCVDDLSAIPGIDGEKFLQEERRLLAQCDNVFVTSMALFDKCKRYNKSTYYFSNVVDIDHFKRNTDRTCHDDNIKIKKGINIVYHGVLSSLKIDFDLVIQTINLCPDLYFNFIGEEPEGQNDERLAQIRCAKNVIIHGYIPYDRLPSYLCKMDVAIFPSLINAYTDAMFPMKLYEYIASGLPIVSTKLKVLAELNEDAICLSDSENFAINIGKTALKGRLSDREIKRIVGENTWSKRFDKMIELVEL